MKTVYLIFMSLSVFILTTVLFIKQNTSIIIGDTADYNTVSISVDKNLSAEDVTTLVQSIQNIDTQNIMKTTVLTPEDQLKDLQSSLPSYSHGFFEDQEITKILNPIIEIQLLNPSQGASFITQVKTLPGIREVTFGNDWATKIKGLFDTLNIILNSIFVLFFIILSFLVAILIRNYLIDAKDSISLKALLGATPQQSFRTQYTSIMIRTLIAYVFGVSSAVFFTFMIKYKVSSSLQLSFIGERLHFLNPTNTLIILIGLILNLVISYALSYQYVQREYFQHD